jgi:2-methylfumaryl-CoA isomerase
LQNVLAGMRVVEGSAFVAAPSGGMALAQLGADVIRFDPPGGGLDYHRWPLAAGASRASPSSVRQDSLYWNGLNKGKRSIAVDTQLPEGRELLSRLIAAPGDDAGLFLTNFPACGWLADERLRAMRSDLIYLNLTGDRHGRSALDYTVNCRVGLPYLTGPAAGGEPINNPLPAWDLLAGQHIALGLLAAERHRSRTGEGQFVRLALADVALATVGHLGYIAEAMLNGVDREPVGNHVYGTFGHDFCSRDGLRVMVVGVTGRQWRALLQATGLTSAAAALGQRLGLDLDQEGDRFAAREAICDLLEPWFSSHDYRGLSEELDAAGVCWGKYQTIAEMVATDPECSPDNPLFELVEQPGAGPYLMPRNPLGFGAVPPEGVRPAPLLGQHTEEILADTLGLASGEIARLYDRGIVAGSAGQ